MNNDRIEQDILGNIELPHDVYWGIHTERARNNFPIGDYKINPSLIRAMAMVKKACCIANFDLGHMRKENADAIL